MATSIFKYNEARAWKSEVDALVQETEAVLHQVDTCVAAIGDGCEGAIVQELVQTAQQMSDKFSTLISAMGELVAALGEVIKAFIDFEDTAIGGIASGVASLIGGAL